jgi:hypothetical protein
MFRIHKIEAKYYADGEDAYDMQKQLRKKRDTTRIQQPLYKVKEAEKAKEAEAQKAKEAEKEKEKEKDTANTSSSADTAASTTPEQTTGPSKADLANMIQAIEKQQKKA